MARLFSLVTGALPYFAVPFILSVILVPIAKRIGLKLNIYAVENKRTVHHGKIVRMGGAAIFIAFMISMAIFMEADRTLNGILLGGVIVFMGGFLDDIFNLRPRYKVLFEVAGALVAMFYGGIILGEIHLPWGIHFSFQILSFLISFIWIVGVTNAINLIDGLDGLSSGITFIVLCTFGILGFLLGRRDVCMICLMLAGAILGFLPYNFHPASIFVGDCGALFFGYMVACISLLGFKTAALITLGMPVLILFIPISDTLIAIIRRKLKGQKISEADKSHLHHVLMYKLHLGHRNTVLVLYAVTALFGSSAILSFYNEPLAMGFTVILLIIAELFVEYSGMINPKFHPILGLCRRLTGHPKKLADERFHDEETSSPQ